MCGPLLTLSIVPFWGGGGGGRGGGGLRTNHALYRVIFVLKIFRVIFIRGEKFCKLHD